MEKLILDFMKAGSDSETRHRIIDFLLAQISEAKEKVKTLSLQDKIKGHRDIKSLELTTASLRKNLYTEVVPAWSCTHCWALNDFKDLNCIHCGTFILSLKGD